MQETEKSSFRKPLDVGQLVQLKRLERPDPDFWTAFERELQQKQLQALVKPSRWSKLRWALMSPRPAVASLAVVAAACAALISFYAIPGWSGEMASRKSNDRQSEPMLLTEAPAPHPPEESDEAEITIPPRTDAFFVVDALRPNTAKSSGDSFRTVAVPETFVGGSDDSAYYVVNAFTTGPDHFASEATLEF